MDIVYLVFIIVTGLCIGSFINVCIYRIPLEKSIVFPSSGCPGCGKKIKAYDLVPVLSYLWLRGKCRNCKAKISVRYPLVEILTAVLFSILFFKFGFNLQFIIYCAITAIMIMILFIDFEHMIIPDGLNLICGLLGIALNIIYPSGDYKFVILNMLYGFLLGGGFFFLLALIGAMGGGDIKLMAALGLIFGWKLLLPLMFLSFVLGGIIGIILLILKTKGLKDMIPFGPYITVACFLTIMYGNSIVEWYLSSLIIK